MKKFFKNLLLYFSAFVPMYILVLVKLLVEIANSNLSFNVLNTINLVTLVILIGGGVFGLVWNVKLSKERSIKVEILDIKNITENHFLGYFSLFVFFAIPLDLSRVSAYCVYVLVLVMIGIVYMTNSLYYINPLLNILGYSFYDVKYREVGTEKEGEVKLFCKKKLIPNQVFCIKIKNNHFCFVDKDEKM